MTTTKKDILIAEFMGLKIITDGISWFDTDYKALKKYDTSWDWLMPVVEKIESFDGFSVRIEGCAAYVVNGDSCLLIQNTNCTLSKIEAVYDMCIQFIQWYNKNK